MASFEWQLACQIEPYRWLANAHAITSALEEAQYVPLAQSSMDKVPPIREALRRVLDLCGNEEASPLTLEMLSQSWQQSLTTQEAQDALFLYGACALLLFHQHHWTGPSVPATAVSTFLAGSETDQKHFFRGLQTLESEGVYHLTTYASLLFVARAAFDALLHTAGAADTARTFTLRLWTVRGLRAHQTLLDDISGDLKAQFDAQRDAMLASSLMHCDALKTVQAHIYLELALTGGIFGDDVLSLVEKAKAASGFRFTLSGALGKRTKFQEDAYAQLIVEATSAPREGATPTPKEKDVEVLDEGNIHEVPLQDDTLLDKIRFDDAAESQKQAENLHVIDQCILLAFCSHIKNTNPADGITTEQMFPFVTKVLTNANNWMVHTSGLLVKSRLESQKSRTAERAVLQLQALVDQMDAVKDNTANRLLYLFQTEYPPQWQVQKELGYRYAGLGVLRSAYEIFHRLELWEDAINCLMAMDEKSKAERLVKTEIVSSEAPNSVHTPLYTAKLWCILGDIQNDPAHYEKAWTVSGHRLARSMRSLGAYHFKRQDIAQAVACFNKALKINPMFEDTWFTTGCGHMQLEEWQDALQCFSRCVALNPENGEAWNNMAAIQIRLDRKRDAVVAFKEALKVKTTNLKIWQNLLWTSLDVSSDADAIFAFRHIAELMKDPSDSAYLDMEALSHLTDTVIASFRMAPEDRTALYHVQQLATIVTTLTDTFSQSPPLWQVLAKLKHAQRLTGEAMEHLLSAYRTSLKGDWSVSAQQFNKVATVVDALLTMYGALDQASQPKYKSSLRLLLSTFLKRSREFLAEEEAYKRIEKIFEEDFTIQH